MTVIDRRTLVERPAAELRRADRDRRRRRLRASILEAIAYVCMMRPPKALERRLRTGSPRRATPTLAIRMRAAVMQDWELRVDDVAEPEPGPGQVLTKVLACGICGSDLHLLRHGEEAAPADRGARRRRATRPAAARSCSSRRAPMVMGHEFCCEVVDAGPGVRAAEARRRRGQHARGVRRRRRPRRSGSPTATPAATPS